MTIESPETYGEDYWAASVEANLFYEEKLEKSLKDLIPDIFSIPDISVALPFGIGGIFQHLLSFPHPGLAAIGGQFVGQVGGTTVQSILTPAMRKTTYAANRQFTDLLIDPATAMTLKWRKWIEEADYINRMTAGGISGSEAQLFFAASQPYPDLQDWLRWARYTGNPENTWSTLFEKLTLDPRTYPVWEWLSLNVLSTDQITTLGRRGLWNDNQVQQGLMRIGWTRTDTDIIKELGFNIPNAMLLIQAGLHEEQSEAKIKDELTKADIHPDYVQAYYDAVLTKPNPTDIIAYHLRQGNSLSQIDNDLKRVGIHPEWLNIYHLQTDRLPPLADIITMAVREAFSPGVARRFGQYEDLPRQFVEFAEQQGLSRDWAERYWAAHWGLPSATQGFEMLHRGIIDMSDLELLLKSLDVMPFWRDRLIQMSYRNLTRVDVRRMYELGVLGRNAVYEAFLALGYNRENATNMTEYVQRQTEESMVHTARDDIVAAFVDRYIDRSEAERLLRDLEIPQGLTKYMLDDAEFKREYDFITEQIKAIKNLYHKGEYDENETRDDLLRLNLPADQVDVYMKQWYYTRKAEGTKTLSKAETFKYVEQGIIDVDFARNELRLMGYDETRVNIYAKAMQWQEPQT